jgi:hypothetical protein
VKESELSREERGGTTGGIGAVLMLRVQRDRWRRWRRNGRWRRRENKGCVEIDSLAAQAVLHSAGRGTVGWGGEHGIER